MQKIQLVSFINSFTENYFLYHLVGKVAEPFFLIIHEAIQPKTCPLPDYTKSPIALYRQEDNTFFLSIEEGMFAIICFQVKRLPHCLGLQVAIQRTELIKFVSYSTVIYLHE